ncbi:MAG: class I SAM-dependent methyltransferase [Bryobacterales bacterium]|nr:class I SAM-dependent methyltransferase [Bryobacterales bacterium]
MESQLMDYSGKSTTEEIRARFDADVERFSNLETGQSAAMDSRLMLDLAASVCGAMRPEAEALLDIGCGAGNYTLRLLDALPRLHSVTAVDLSQPMLDRARLRVLAARAGIAWEELRGDIRELDLGRGRFDFAVAAAVLHHLRGEGEWRMVFRKIHDALKPGGALWIADMVEHAHPLAQQAMWTRYGEYLAGLRDEAYRDHVFAYIEREDTPRPAVWQLDRLREAGFGQVDILHKNGPFALFGAYKI